MKLIKTLSRAAGLGLCVAAFSSTALAGPGGGNGNAPETPPGQEKKAETPAAAAPAPAPAPAPQAAAAPGQEKKAEKQAEHKPATKAAPKPAAALAQSKSHKPATPPGQAKKAAPKPAAAPAQSKSHKPATPPGQAKKAEKQAEHKPAKASSESNGRSAEAKRHVIVCHSTGSASNPYVVINIPSTAWTEGHSRHGGRTDKLLKDPASRPGSKDGFTKAGCGSTTSSVPATVNESRVESKTGCPATVTTTEQVAVGIWHATGAYKDGERKFVLISPSLKSAHWSKHADDKPAYATRTVTRSFSGANCAAVVSTNTTGSTGSTGSTGTAPTSTKTADANASAAPPVGGVAGAISPAPAGAGAAANPADEGGVLGAVASAPEAIARTATGNLPFTGLPLWIAALLGTALLAAGLTLRRSS